MSTSGVSAGDVRVPYKDEATELRDSMREFGWQPGHPVIKDEHGNTLVGHRRLRVAQELGIEPDIVTIEFGEGTDADARRARLAIASNLGARPLSAKDRGHIAKDLRVEKGWSIKAISETLNVSTSTVSNDLSEIDISKSGNAKDTKGRRRSTGRPRGSGTKPKANHRLKAVREHERVAQATEPIEPTPPRTLPLECVCPKCGHPHRPMNR